jgi:hypothetical protein
VGRDFTEDDLAAGQAVGILTYGAWQRWFAGRPDAVGRVGWRLGEAGARENVVIIGVLPSDAPGRTPELDPDADVLVLASRTSDVRAPQGRAFAPIVRPAPGVTAGQLQIRLEAASRALSASDADAARFGFRLESLRRPPGRWRR